MVSYQTFEVSYQNFRFSYQIEFTDAKLPFLVLISAFSPGICIISDFLPLYLVRFSLQVGDIYQIFCGSYQNISFSYQNCMVSYQTFEVSYQNFRFSYQIEFTDAKLPFLVLISAFPPGICIISSDLPLYLVRFSLQVGDIYQIFCGSYQNISFSYQKCMVSYQISKVSYQNFRFSYQIASTDAKLPILVQNPADQTASPHNKKNRPLYSVAGFSCLFSNTFNTSPNGRSCSRNRTSR